MPGTRQLQRPLGGRVGDLEREWPLGNQVAAEILERLLIEGVSNRKVQLQNTRRKVADHALNDVSRQQQAVHLVEDLCVGLWLGVAMNCSVAGMRSIGMCMFELVPTA